MVGWSDLTNRESEVAELLLQGLTNREIAAVLCCSPFTARTHVSQILAKFEARNRVELTTKLISTKYYAG